MAQELTNRTKRALQELSIEPNIMIRAEGLDILFSATPVKEFIKINDPGFFIGAEGYFIGGLFNIEPDKNKVVIDSKSTTFNIRQQINHDEGESSSISTINVGMVDKDGFITLLISPGFLIEELMGRKIQVFVTYGNVSFFEDAIEIFKGFVVDIDAGAGLIKLKINHPDNKKKVSLFKNVETSLVANINATQTTFTLDDASTFEEPGGPLTTYLRINNEIMLYTGVTGNTITGITRGAFGTTATGHNSGDGVKTIYALEDNPLDLALKIMMSGHGTDPVHEDIPVSSFLKIGASNDFVANAVYFNDINLDRDFGLRQGDTVTITGATNGANNVTNRVVDEVVRAEQGYYAILDGAALVLEEDSPATMNTFTQYNVLPDGMKMTPDEVDIDEHIRIRDIFHVATQMRFFMKEDKIDGKEFIEKQLYQPIACYALPRKAKSSVGFASGPIPGEDIISLDNTNVIDPQNITIKRTQAKSFFNEVIYKFDEPVTSEDVEFATGRLYISEESKNRIKGNNRLLEIESRGLRTDLNAVSLSNVNAQRILDRYKFAAEIVNLRTKLSDTAGVEVGDIVVGDLKNLKVSDSKLGTRDFKPRLFEVLDRAVNIKTGKIDLRILDTGIALDVRYGLMSPVSLVAGIISNQQIVIGPDPMYPSKFGDDEFRKWENMVNLVNPISILIRNEDWSIQEDLVVNSLDENVFTLDQPFTQPLTKGMYVEFTGYNDPDVSDRQKLIYAFMSDQPAFDDGGFIYVML